MGLRNIREAYDNKGDVVVHHRLIGPNLKDNPPTVFYSYLFSSYVTWLEDYIFKVILIHFAKTYGKLARFIITFSF